MDSECSLPASLLIIFYYKNARLSKKGCIFARIINNTNNILMTNKFITTLFAIATVMPMAAQKADKPVIVANPI